MESERLVDRLYLYGIVRRSALDLAGVQGVEEGDAVWLVEDGELACAVSAVSRADYSQEALNTRADQLDWLAPRAVRHQQVVHYLQQAGAVVPLRFGTLCATDDDLRRILQARRGPLLQLLAFLQSREEWGVKVFADPDLIGRAIEPDGRASGETPPVSPGGAYFLRKKQQQLAEERTMARLGELDGEIYERLLPWAVDVRRRQSQYPPPDPSRAPVLNLALLVDRDKSAALAELVGRLEADYRSCGVTAELSGPWAPYSFCTGLGRAPAGAEIVQVAERCES